MTRLVIDISNWTGTLDFTQVARLKEAGVTGAVVGTQKTAITHQQIMALESDGIPVEAVYCFLYWDERDTARVGEALGYSKPVWLDCEYVTNPMPGTGKIRNSLMDAKARCGDQFAGFYTGAWWWIPYTANVDFSAYPLWHAAYQSRPESLHLPAPYGGWTEAKMWQFSSSGLAGVNLDLSIAADLVVMPPTAPRIWLYGSEAAGLELRGKQQVTWNDWVEVDKLGTDGTDGGFVGSHLHREGETWRQVLT